MQAHPASFFRTLSNKIHMTLPVIITIFMLPVWSKSGQITGLDSSLGIVQKGIASYYHHRFEGRKTAFGEVYRNADLTAAHRTLPYNTMLEVTNPSTNKSVIVRVNDRGPYSRSRLLDVSKGAAKELDMVRAGLAKVTVRIVGLNGVVLLPAEVGDSLKVETNTDQSTTMYQVKK
jgi:rare lipoprotein A